MTQLSYESVYRRTALVLAMLPAAILAIGLAVYVSLRFIEDGNTALDVMMWALGAVFALFVAAAVSALRVHRWTIEADGVRIEERPQVPFAGLRRRALVAFPDIAALRNVESSVDFLIELAARDGRQFRLFQIRRPMPPGAGPALELQSVEAFADAIRAAAARAGHPLPSRTEGLSFWNRPPGLCLIAVLFALSLAFAGMTAWALLGGGLEVRPRGSEMAAIALVLPVGVGYWLYRALKRRRAVLGQDRRGSIQSET